MAPEFYWKNHGRYGPFAHILAETRQRTAICCAYYTLVNAVGTFIGATIGGQISSMEINFFSYGPIVFVFVISAVCRMVFYLIMIGKLKEVRPVEELKLNNKVLWYFKPVWSIFGFNKA